MKKIRAAVTLLAALVLLSAVILPAPSARAMDYSTVRVRLSASLDDLNVGVNGVYTLLETGQTVSSDVNISLTGDGATLAVTDRSSGSVLYQGTECTLMRQSGTLRQYNRQHGWRYYLGDMHYQVASNGTSGQKIAVTNYVGMEDYLIGVVAYEMSNTWPLEALKAQAVCARSYAACKIAPSASYDIVDTASDQVYKGYDASNTNVIEAVKATKGEVLMNSAGQVVRAYYGASNGGQTELTSNAWSGEALPYYPMKDDPYDLRNPYSASARLTFPKVVSAATPPDAKLEAYLKTLVAPKLEALGYSGFTDTFSITGTSAMTAYDPKYPSPSRFYQRVRVTLMVSPDGSAGGGSSSGAPQFMELSGITDYVLYVNENRLVTLQEREQILAQYNAQLIQAGGSGGSIPIEVDFAFSELQGGSYQLFTNTSLRLFYVEETNQSFDIVNVRYGHGVGMSQRGAQQMATEGMTYRQILDFYYTNVTISQISTASSSAPDSTGGTGQGDLVVASLPEPSAVSGTLQAQTKLRKSPASSASSVATLKSGASVHVLGQSGDWLLVLTSSSEAGYLPVSAVALDLSEDVLAMATGTLTVYAGPGTAYASAGSVQKGELVALVADSGDYCLVDTGSVTGFVKKSGIELVVGAIEAPLDSDSRYGYAASTAPLLKSSSGTTVVTTIPEGYVFEVLTQTRDQKYYNVIYDGQKGVVYQSQTVLLSRGAAHPNPRQLLAEKDMNLFEGTVNYVANTEALNLRAVNSASANILGTLPRGEKVIVLGAYSSWKKVQSETGIIGFVNASYLSSVKPSDAGTGSSTVTVTSNTPSTDDGSGVKGTVNASSVNVRSAKSTSAEIVGRVEKGDVVTLLTQSTSWYKIRLGSLEGYVKKDYITRGVVDYSEQTTAAPTPSPDAREEIATVTASSLNIRKSASTDAAVAGTLKKGDTVTLLKESGDWYQIRFGSVTGYVMTRYLSIGDGNKSSSALTGYVTATALNVRQSASTSSASLGRVEKGDEVELLAQNGDWYKIRFGDMTGYVKKDYISRDPVAAEEPKENSGDSAILGYVSASSLNLREKASTSSASLGQLKKGDEVELLAQSGDWYKIKANGVTGYVKKEYISREPVAVETTSSSSGEKAAAIGTISANNVNLRPTASTSGEPLATLSKGTQVEVLKKSGDYYKVRYSGVTGYVLKTYVGSLKPVSSSSGSSASSSNASTTKKARVSASELNVRNSSGSTVLFKLTKGQIVEILGTSGDTYQIKYDGKSGYAAKSYLTVLSSSQVGKVKKNVTLRAGASTSAEKLGTLTAGIFLEILKDEGDWLKVSVNGQNGYVSASYVSH